MRSFRFYRWLGGVLVLAGAAAGFGQEAAEMRTVRVGVLLDNYPFSFRTERGEVEGFAYDLVREIEQVMGLKFTRVVGGNKEIHAAFRAGQLAMLQSYAHFPERESEADFSVPYIQMTGAIFVRSGETGVQTLADLRGRRVAVHAGSLGETVLRRAGLADSIRIVDSIEEAVRQVAGGQADATLMGRLSGLTLVHHLGVRNLQALNAAVPGYAVRYCLAVQEGDKELLAKLNEGLAILVRTGRFDALYQKWFGHVEPRGYTREQVMAIVMAGLLLALVVLLWANLRQRALRREIARQAAALRASEERYRGLFEGDSDGLLVVGPVADSLVIEQVNPAAQCLLGLAANPAEGARRFREVLPADAALAARLEAAVRAARRDEYEYQRANGTWLRVSVSPQGRHTVITLVDRTEAVQTREQLRRQDEQLQQKQKLEAIGTLAGGVAHDFNNLLTAIMGNTELARMSLRQFPEETAMLDQVLQASHRARQLVQQILTFSRRTEPKREVLPVAPVVEETISLLRLVARGAVEFVYEPVADLPHIQADSAQLHQVLMNIGTNAVQAMRGTPGQLVFTTETVDVSEQLAEKKQLLASGWYVRIGLRDTGPGMTPEVLARIFEPFFTTKPAGEGTGLGLSVVHGIMQQHGGAVTVYSQPGRGTMFHLYFPVAVIPEVPAPAAPAFRVGHGERVLLVDDDGTIVKMATDILHRLGYRVTAHTDPQHAWAAFAAAPAAYDLLLTDLTMPGQTGLQLAQRVRQLRATLPVIVTSGFFTNMEELEIAALGRTAVLPKPLTIDTLSRIVAQSLVPAVI